MAAGAQPVALLNQIRFGPLSQPESRHRLREVVDGMAEYGRTVGVPIVGGEVAFSESYTDNPLVNVMCVGILRQEELVRGEAGTKGTKLVLLGAATGPDGIGGVSILASTGARRWWTHPHCPSPRVILNWPDDCWGPVGSWPASDWSGASRIWEEQGWPAQLRSRPPDRVWG